MCWRRNKLWFIEPGVTWLRAVANTMLIWKDHKYVNTYFAIDETCCIRRYPDLTESVLLCQGLKFKRKLCKPQQVSQACR